MSFVGLIMVNGKDKRSTLIVYSTLLFREFGRVFRLRRKVNHNNHTVENPFNQSFYRTMPASSRHYFSDYHVRMYSIRVYISEALTLGCPRAVATFCEGRPTLGYRSR